MSGDSIDGNNVKGDCLIGGGDRRTTANSFSDADSTWYLNESTEGTVTIEVGSLLVYFTTHIEKDDFLRKHRLGPCVTLKG